MTGPIRLLIADDHPVVRDGLRGIFEASDEFEVVGEADDGAWRREVLELVRRSVEDKLSIANPRYLESDIAIRNSGKEI